jgi:hypothetical protein
VSSQDLIFPKTSASSAWPELLAQAPPSIQQQLLEEQRTWQQHHSDLTKQKHDITNSNELFAKSLENLSKASRQDEKKVADVLASQQQQAQYEAFLNQMFQIQRKASTGHELSQQQMAYAQKYMQEFGYGKGFEFQALNQNLDLLSKQINYQNISNQMNLSNYQHYVQQMQQAYGLKVPDQEMLLSAAAWHAQQQEAAAAGWCQQQLGLDKMGDLEKMAQGGMRELEQMALKQGKDKARQNNPATSSAQEQRAFIERFQAQEKEMRLLQEQQEQKEKEKEKERERNKKKKKENEIKKSKRERERDGDRKIWRRAFGLIIF